MRTHLLSISTLAVLAAATAVSGCASPDGIEREVAGERRGGTLAPLVVDGTADGTRIELARGQALIVRLPSNPSTGYSWRENTLPDASVLRRVASEYVPAHVSPSEVGIVGRGGIQVWAFEGVTAGTTQVGLAHYPPGGGAAADRFFVEVRVK